jgi:shikimate dehydrogenase
MGLFPDVEACPALLWESLEPDTLVADVVFNPPLTRFLREAQKRGCRTLDGLGMLVNQGVIGVKYWSGVDVNADVMKACLSKIFEVGAGD